MTLEVWGFFGLYVNFLNTFIVYFLFFLKCVTGNVFFPSLNLLHLLHKQVQQTSL